MSRRRHLARVAKGARDVSGAVTGALIGGAAAAILLALLALARGPVELRFLAAPMEALVERALEGADARIGAVEAVLREEGRLRPGLRLRDLALYDAAGRRLFTAPSLRAGLDLRALARGELRAGSAELRGAALTLRRNEAGDMSVALGGAAVSAAPAGGAGLDPSFSGRIALRDARLTIIDESHSARVTLAPARIEAEIAQGALHASFDAALGQGSAAPARIDGVVDWTEGRGGRVDLHVAGARTREIAKLLRELTPLAEIELVFDASGALALDGGGAPVAADLRVAAENGAARLGGRRIAISGLAADLGYDRAADRATIRALSLSGPDGAATLSGAVDLSRDARDDVDGAALELRARALSLDLPELFPDPVSFDSAHLVARLSRDTPEIEVAGLTLRRGAMALRASGKAREDAQGWRGAARLVGRGVREADIHALWPIGVAPGARDWVRAELTRGDVPQFDLLARVSPEEEGVAISFVFEDGTAHYLRPLPPIARGAGWGVVDLRRFGLGLREGEVRPEGFAPVDLAGSTFLLPDVDDPRAVSYPVVRGRGPLGGILSVLDMEPLGLVSKVGLDPGGVKGEADAQARLVLPLLKDLRLDEVEVETRARLRDVALVAPGIERRVTVARFVLEADTRQLSVTGPVVVDGVPMEVAATESFSPARGQPRSRARIAARLTPARARALGLDPGERIDGAAEVRADLRVFDGNIQRIDATLDLTDAALSAQELGWRKPAGRRASARLDAQLGPGGDRLRSFDYRGGGLSLAGSARFAGDGEVSALSLSRFRLDDRADLALELAREGAGWRVSATGAHLDVGLLEGGEDDPEDDSAPFSFDATLDRLTLRPALELRAVRASGRLAGDQSGEAGLSGRLGAAQVTATYRAETGQAPALVLSTNDLGGALRGGDLYPDAYGGTMTARMRLTSLNPLRAQGRAEGGGVRIARESGLARRVAQSAPEEARRLLEAEGVKVNKANVNFTLSPEALTLSDGVANGPSIGLTLEGRFDRRAERLDLSGVFTPAYGLNSAIGAVPILGALLTGGDGQGIFAFNYRVEGPLDDPKLVFNPLSGLAPGVLRNLFQP